MAVGIAVAIHLVVLLVIILCRVKDCEGGDLRYNGSVERAAFIEVRFVLGRFLALFLAVVKNSASVLGAHIVALTIQGGGVMCFPENFQQFGKTDFSRIIYDLQAFRVTGFTTTHFFVGGILGFAAGVTGGYLNHSFQGGEYRFGAPEATVGQGGDLSGRQGGIVLHGRVFHGRDFFRGSFGLGTGR